MILVIQNLVRVWELGRDSETTVLIQGQISRQQFRNYILRNSLISGICIKSCLVAGILGGSTFRALGLAGP